MSAIALTPEETRRNNLFRIARITTFLGLLAASPYIFLGISSQNGYNFINSGVLILFSIVSYLIVRSRKAKRSQIGPWHLLFTGSLAALVISTIQADAGAEVGTTILIINLMIIILTIRPEHVIRGALISVIVSISCGALAFYSPIPQAGNATDVQVLIWVSRVSTVAFLVLILTQFRSLNLASKFLISFLSVVVLISMTLNVIMSTTTTNTLTRQLGQELYAVAESRSTLIGNLISGHVEKLTTLSLDDSIQDAINTANKAYTGNESDDLNKILNIDNQWRAAVAAQEHSFVTDWPLNNEIARDLKEYRSYYPDNIETFVTDINGALLGSNNLTSDYYQADEVWWQTAYNNGEGKVYISLPEYDESADAFSILIAVPIFDEQEGEIIGILRTTLSVDKLFATLQQVGVFGETGGVDIIFPATPAMRLHNNILEEADQSLLASLDALASQLYTRGTYQGLPSIYAKAEVSTLANIPEINKLGWIAVVRQDSREALEPVQRLARSIGLIGTIMAGIASLLSVVLAQRLAEPILTLTSIANLVANGNLDVRSRVDNQDELGQLSNAFNEMTGKLKESMRELEVRVEERTAELEASSQKLQKRAEQFEAIAQIAKTITSIQEIETLLPRITQLASQIFGFYHVGLFLLDESRQYAVLSAANSEGGQQMLARKHKLEVGRTGMVGFVTSTGDPRIALDTGADAVYFDNPDLPDTRSELALPLMVGRSIIGALDVQSTEPNAFSEADVEVFSILADEISIAIENARLFEESQRVLANAQTAIGEYTLEAWQRTIRRRKVVGYELSGRSIRALEGPRDLKRSSAKIPLKLRDRIIGSMNISMPDDKELNQDEVEITQALANRIGIAIENATLLEESQRAAVKEQAIGEITGKIGSSINLRNVLQTAVEELGHNMPGAEIVIELMNKQDATQGFISGEIK